MSNISASGIDTVRDDYPYLYTALNKMVDGINQLGSVSGIGSSSPTTTPKNTGQLSVGAADGIFDVAIQDPSPQRGEFYFLEWDTDPSFTDASVIFLGCSRNWRGYLGNLTTYWRFYKQLLGSNVSGIAYFGNPPTAVVGGGSAGPAPQGTQGSGTSQTPGAGFGPIGSGTPQ